MISSRIRRISISVALLMSVYIAAPWIVFDVKQPAYAFDEDYFEGVRVAYGPRPRWPLVSPRYHAFLFDGREWPFLVFRTYCESWLDDNRFAKPSRWRKKIDEMPKYEPKVPNPKRQ